MTENYRGDPSQTLEALVHTIAEAAAEKKVEEMTRGLTAGETPQAPRALLTVEQLAEILQLGSKDASGKRPGGVRTLRQWIQQGRIPYRKAGDRTLFDLDEVLAWTKEEAERDRRRRSGALR